VSSKYCKKKIPGFSERFLTKFHEQTKHMRKRCKPKAKQVFSRDYLFIVQNGKQDVQIQLQADRGEN